MTVVLTQLIILFAFSFVGYLICKGGLVHSEGTKILSTLVVYVFNPAMTINSFAQNFTISYIKEKYWLLIVSGIIVVVLFLISKSLANLISKKEYERKVFLYSIMVPNIGFIGYPLAQKVFGEVVLLDVMFFGMPLSMFIYAVGYPMLTGNGKIRIKRAVINPGIISIFIGAFIGLTGLKLPTVATDILTTAGNCMGPIAMLLFGVTISEFKFSELINNKKAYVITILRLGFIPALLYLSLVSFLPKELLIPVMIVYVLPCGLNTVVFPKLVGEDCKTGAGLALISSLLSLITTPLWLGLI